MIKSYMVADTWIGFSWFDIPGYYKLHDIFAFLVNHPSLKFSGDLLKICVCQRNLIF